MLDPARSTAHQGCQILSQLLSGTPSIRVWQASGWGCFTILHQQQPYLVADMRRATVIAEVWLWLKLVRRFRQLPHLVALVADTSRDMNDRVQAAKDFWYATAHDLDDGFALPLRNRIHNWRDLFQPRWQRVLYYWAKAHRLHSRRSEAKHASNKKATATCTDYLHFVSRCANQDRLSTIFHDEIPEPLAASPAKIKGPLPSLQLGGRINAPPETNQNSVARSFERRIKKSGMICWRTTREISELITKPNSPRSFQQSGRGASSRVARLWCHWHRRPRAFWRTPSLVR